MNTILRTLETEHKNWVIEHSGYDQLYRVKNAKTGVKIIGAYTTELIAHEALNAYAAQPKRNMPGPGAGNKGPRTRIKKPELKSNEITESVAMAGFDPARVGIDTENVVTSDDTFMPDNVVIPEDAVDLNEELAKMEQEPKDMRVM